MGIKESIPGATEDPVGAGLISDAYAARLSGPDDTTAAAVVLEEAMRTVLEGVVVLLAGACALALTLVEFHETSMSMSILMVSTISSARLVKAR